MKVSQRLRLLCFAVIVVVLLLYFLGSAYPMAGISTHPLKTKSVTTSSEEFNSFEAFATTENSTEKTQSNTTLSEELSSAEPQINSSEAEEHIYRYVAVNDPAVIGKSFELSKETSHVVTDFLKNKLFKRNPMTLDAKTTFFDIIALVSGASSNHFGELMANVNFFPSRFPGKKLFCYDIGLSESEADQLKKTPHVVYRKFDFERYPPHVKNLLNYAWKILIIGELLSEHDGVMWFDTSVKIYGDLSHILDRLVHFKSGILFYLKMRSTTHSIAAATDPGMIEYFPLTPQGKTGLVTDMLPGASILVFNTADVQEHVIKWASICALVKDCIEPPGSTIQCPPSIWTIPRDQFAGCHRYDQALFSLLVTNLYNNTRERYSLNNTEALADLSFLGAR